MSLSIFESIGVLSSWILFVWLFFTTSYWLDRRAERKKQKEAWDNLAFSQKVKYTSNKVAKTNIGKAVGSGVKKATAPIVNVANKAADITAQTIDNAVKASATVKSVATKKSVKKAVSKVKVAGDKVKDFFRLEPIEDEDDDKDDD